MAGRESPRPGAGIGGVDGHIGKAVEGHGGGTSGQHGGDDPKKLMSGGKAGSGEHGSAERERESEDGVLPLDHLQGDAKVAEDGHREIVRQMRLADSNWRFLVCGRFPAGGCGLMMGFAMGWRSCEVVRGWIDCFAGDGISLKLKLKFIFKIVFKIVRTD